MLINCDMGESFGPWQMGNDGKIMPYIDMANIACGFHASDPDHMAATIKLAKKHGVIIGAHPGFNDKQGFGRRNIRHTPDEIHRLTVYQTGALYLLCKTQNAVLEYIKPHGALNSLMMSDKDVFIILIKALKDMDLGLKLVIPSGKENKTYQAAADKYGVKLIFEVFADRRYLTNGKLTPRESSGSVYQNPDDILLQTSGLLKGYVISSSGDKLELYADSICIHGDNPASITACPRIKKLLHC